MVEFAKGKALFGALTILLGSLVGLIGAVQMLIDPETWSYFETNSIVIVPPALWLIFAIIAILGGFFVATGNSSGNTWAVIAGLISVLGFAFLLQPPVLAITLSMTYYVKGAVGPIVYLMGGLFGLAIKEG